VRTSAGGRGEGLGQCGQKRTRGEGGSILADILRTSFMDDPQAVMLFGVTFQIPVPVVTLYSVLLNGALQQCYASAICIPAVLEAV